MSRLSLVLLGALAALTIPSAALAAPPSVRFSPSPYFPGADQTISFSGVASDPEGKALTYAWDFDEDGATDSTQLSPTLVGGFPAGDHIVAFTATDGDGEQRTFEMLVHASAQNTPPRAFDLTLGPSVRAGTAAPFSTFFYDSDSSAPLAYAWDFGDSATAATSSGSHTFAVPGSYVVVAGATDGAGGASSLAQVVDVHAGNTPPKLSNRTQSPLAPAVGQTTSFDIGVSDDMTTASGMTYAWDFGDGATASTRTPSHAFASAGDKLVTVTVTDQDGGATEHSVIVPVAPPAGAPTSRFVSGTDYQPSEHQDSPRAGVGIAFVNNSNTGTGGVVSSSHWDFGDGATSNAFQPTHAFSTPGDYAVTLKVTDAQGRSHTSVQTMHVHADDLPPVITAEAGSAVAKAGVGIDLSATAVDLDDPDADLQYDWDFGDGSPHGSAATAGHTYAAAGSYVAVVTVTSGSTSARQAVAVDVREGNSPPQADFSYRREAPAGESLSFGGAGNDPDGDALTYAWDFGDGATSTVGTPHHTFAAPGAYFVRLTQDDGNGGVSSAGYTVFITAAAVTQPPSDTTTPPADTTQPPSDTTTPPADTQQPETSAPEIRTDTGSAPATVEEAPKAPEQPKAVTSPTVPVTPAAAPVVADLAAALGAPPALRIRSLAAKRSATASFTARGAGKVEIRWRAGRVLLARGVKTVSRAGNVKVRVALTAAGGKLLKRSRRSLKVTAAGTFTGKGAKPVTATRTFTLRR